MALGTDDVQPAGRHDLLLVFFATALCLVQRGLVFLGRRIEDAQPLLVEDLRSHHLGVAAEEDVGAAAGHVGRDRHCSGSARLRDDLRLAFVELGVQHVVLDAAPLEHLGQHLADLDADRAHQHRPAELVLRHDLVDDRVPLAVLGPKHEIGEVVADHLSVGRDDDDLEPVDLAELFGLGLRRPGHARQLVVHAEVVLEGDRRERL